MAKISKSELDTPALLVNLPAMESNLMKMERFFRGTTAKLRPHFKVHKIPALSHKQLEAGAIGITCAKVGEAEVLLNHGIRDILIANEIVGETKIRRLIETARQANLIVAVDNEKAALDMARIARDKKTEVQVLVDVNVGMNRCGVRPGDEALALAKTIVKQRGLKFRGLMGYEGHLQELPPGEEKERLCRQSMQLLVNTQNLLHHHAIGVEIVSAGGTGTYSITGKFPGVTEIQAGTYLIMDTNYEKACVDFKPSLSVLTTIVSTPERDRIIIDAGLKAISGEFGRPVVKGIEGLQLKDLHAEHGILEYQGSISALEVGDKIELWVYYADGTFNLYDQVYGVREEEVEEIFQVEARGKAT